MPHKTKSYSMNSRDKSGTRKKKRTRQKNMACHYKHSDNSAKSYTYLNLFIDRKIWKRRLKELDNNPWVMTTLGIILGMLIAVLIMIITIIILEYQESKMYPEFERGLFPQELDVNYNEMTSSEILHTKKVLYEVKPQYLIPVKNLTFTTNQSLIQDKSRNKEDRVIGLNIADGEEVFVLYDEDTNGLCRLLQHELLHSIVNDLAKDTEEWFVDDMDSINIVYRPSGGVCN